MTEAPTPPAADTPPPAPAPKQPVDVGAQQDAANERKGSRGYD